VRLGVIVVALAIGVGLCAAGCGSSTPSYGDVIMTVTVPDGVQVSAVQYTMNDNVNAPSTGVVGGPQPEHQYVELVAHVAPSDHYTVTVQAESTDGQKTCEGSAPFKVMSGVTTRVQIALKCGGQVLVGIGVSCNDTPLVDVLVSPIAATVGSYVIGRAGSARPDGGPLTFTWSAPSGTFSDPNASQTNFTCTQVGPVKVTLQVADDEMCQQSYTSTVTCLPGPDGGALDAGAPDAGRG
jgi:hypothetical protein